MRPPNEPSRSHRIAFVLRKFDAAAWGGTETHVAAVGEELTRQGYAIDVHAPRHENPSRGELPTEVSLRRYHTLDTFLGSTTAKSALLANGGNIASLDLPWKLAVDRSIALTHAHTMGRIGGAVRLAMRATHRPYVLSVHGPLFDGGTFFADEVERRRREVIDLGRPLGWLLGSRRVVADAARVISFNDGEHRHLEQRVGRRAVRMDHGVDVTRLSSGTVTSAQRRWPELGEAPVVAVLGRLCRQKNQALALATFAVGAPKAARLVFAGAETDPGYRRSLEDEAHRLGIRSRVHFLGNVRRHSEVPDLLARASVVLVPSLHEAFGLAVLEAWAARVPVLFSPRHGLADLHRRANLDDAAVPTLDVASWGPALAALLSDRGRRETQACAGEAFVHAHFRWEVVANALGRLYEEVLDEHASPRGERHRGRRG